MPLKHEMTTSAYTAMRAVDIQTHRRITHFIARRRVANNIGRHFKLQATSFIFHSFIYLNREIWPILAQFVHHIQENI